MGGSDRVLVWRPVRKGHRDLMLSLLEAPDLLHEMGFPWAPGCTYREQSCGPEHRHYCCSKFPGSKVV